jgi:O-antigen/teichoic acid export membrane protein
MSNSSNHPGASDPNGPMMSSAVQVAGNSLWSIAGWFGALLVGFIASPILIRLLGRDQYGLMALLNTILTPMGLLDFGIGEATVKYVAESIGKKDYVGAGKHVRSTLAFNLSVGILGGIVIVLLSGFLVSTVFKIPEQNQDLARRCLLWVALSWCVTQGRQAFMGLVMSMQRYKILTAATLISQSMTTLAGLGALLLGGTLLDLVRAQAIVAILTGLGGVMVARHLFPKVSHAPSFDKSSFRKTLSFGCWQMLSNVGGLLAQQSQRWLLGVLLPIATVGFYNVSFQLVAAIYSLTYRVGQVLFPAVSHMQGQAREEHAARLTVQANWVLSTLAIAGFVPLFVFADDLLLLWVGSDFSSNAAGVLRIMVIATMLSCLFTLHHFFLLGTARTNWLAAMAFVQGIVSFMTSALLIPKLGLSGAGWGMASGTAIHVTVLILMWKRLFRNWFSAQVYFSATFSQCFVGILVAIAFLVIREGVVWSPHWASLGVAGLFCALFSGIVIVTVDSLLPGGRERRRLLLKLSSTMFPAWSGLNKWMSSET